MTPDSADAIQYLLDRSEIEDVVKRYCRAIDRLDVELLRSVYHPDATDHHGAFSGNAHEFAEYIMESLRATTHCGMHTITHSLTEIRSPYATVESYYLAYQRMRGGFEKVSSYFGERYTRAVRERGLLDGPQDYLGGGRYIDLMEKRGGVWRIKRREITVEWGICQPTSQITDEGMFKLYNLPGRLDRSDPVYKNVLPKPPKSD